MPLLSETSARLENVVGSYLNLWVPKRIRDSRPKYSMQVVIPKNNKVALKEVKELTTNAIKHGIMNKGIFSQAHAKAAGFKVPLKPAAEDGSQAFNCNTEDPPRVFIKRGDKMVPVNAGTPDENEIYSGCICSVVVNFAPYAVKIESGGVSRGVGAYLTYFMKTDDGPRLDGRISVDAAFEEAVAELGDDLVEEPDSEEDFPF